MQVVGLTGGIATGKNTAWGHLAQQFGVQVVEADEISRQLLLPEGAAYKAVVKQFGKELLTETQAIDRAKLAEIVFNDAAKLKLLESIVHPKVYQAINKQLKTCKRQGVAHLLVSSPLLLETEYHKKFEHMLVILASEPIQVDRLLTRGYSEAIAKARVAAQLNNEQRLEIIKNRPKTQVIWNNHGLKQFKTALDQAWQLITETPKA